MVRVVLLLWWRRMKKMLMLRSRITVLLIKRRWGDRFAFYRQKVVVDKRAAEQSGH
jgi:hypothetical protein